MPTIGIGKRAGIALMSIIGLSGISLSLIDVSPVSAQIDAPPSQANGGNLPSEKLRESLLLLAETVTEAESFVAANAEHVFSQESLASVSSAASAATYWLNEAARINDRVISEAQEEAIVAQSELTRVELANEIATAEYRVALWEQGQQIVASVEPIFRGGEAAVAVWNLENDQPVVQWNADTAWTPGSTYKVYTAYSILNAIDTGQVSPNNVAGWTLDACFYDMILVSDNDCAQDWLNTWGFERVEQEVHAIGATDTYFTPGEFITTANDLSHFMEQLYDGTILSEASRQYLIDDLYTHIHRYGIPAALPETDRAFNKVGFVFSYMNDTAVVYTPQGDYAITIMTNGLDWEQIRQATAVIRQFLDSPVPQPILQPLPGEQPGGQSD